MTYVFRIKPFLVAILCLGLYSGISFASHTHTTSPATLTSYPDEPMPNKFIYARQVMNRKNLMHFVNVARNYLEYHYYASIAGFRQEGGAWRSDSVYIFIFDQKGRVLFHAARPDMEGKNLFDVVDAKGVHAVKRLIAAAKSGVGFVEHLWNNPAKVEDKEMTFPKVSYAKTFLVKGMEFIVSSGFYPGCENHIVNLSEEIELWSGPATEIQSPFSQVPIKQKIEITLTPLANTHFIHPPEKEPVENTFAGVGLLKVPESGTYMISLGSRAWIDIVDIIGPEDGSKLVTSLVTSHQHSMKPSCQIFKTVGFKLTAGKQYTLQLSSSAKEKIMVMVSKH